MYHPTSRILTVLELLQSKASISGPELAALLEVEVRTVRRYITILQDIGIPIEANLGRHGGYRLRPGFKLPPLMFTEEEATALVVSLLGTAWLELAQSAGVVEGTLAKISRVLPLATREKLKAISAHLYFSAPLPQARPDVSLVIAISQAIGQQQRIELSYRSFQGQLTHRKVEPYGVVGWNGHWYLVAYCCLRQDYRTFRLDRIEQLEVVAQTFERVEAFDYRAFMLEQPATTPGNFRLKVEFQASLFTVQQKIPASYGSLTPVANGVVFESNYEDLTDMAHYLMSLGLPFVIHHPVELRQALLELAEKMVQFATAPTISNQAGSSLGD